MNLFGKVVTTAVAGVTLSGLFYNDRFRNENGGPLEPPAKESNEGDSTTKQEPPSMVEKVIQNFVLNASGNIANGYDRATNIIRKLATEDHYFHNLVNQHKLYYFPNGTPFSPSDSTSSDSETEKQSSSSQAQTENSYSIEGTLPKVTSAETKTKGEDKKTAKSDTANANQNNKVSTSESFKPTESDFKNMLTKFNQLNHIPCLTLNAGKWINDPNLTISLKTAQDIMIKADECHRTALGIIHPSKIISSTYAILLDNNDIIGLQSDSCIAAFIDLIPSNNETKEDALLKCKSFNDLDFMCLISDSRLGEEKGYLWDNYFDNNLDLSYIENDSLKVIDFYSCHNNDSYEYTTFFQDKRNGKYYMYVAHDVNADLSSPTVAEQITKVDLMLATDTVNAINNQSLKEELKKPISHLPYLIPCTDGSYIQSSTHIININQANKFQVITDHQHPGYKPIALVTSGKANEKLYLALAAVNPENSGKPFDFLEIK